MKTPILYMMVAVMAAGAMSGCGYKGKLKAPAQIEQENAKKAAKAEKKRREGAEKAGQE